MYTYTWNQIIIFMAKKAKPEKKLNLAQKLKHTTHMHYAGRYLKFTIYIYNTTYIVQELTLMMFIKKISY